MFSAKVTLKFQDSMTGVTGGLRYFIAIDFFCILAPGYCAEYKIVNEILMACQDICVKHIDKVGEINGRINGEIKSLGSARLCLRCELPRPHTKFRVSALRDAPQDARMCWFPLIRQAKLSFRREIIMSHNDCCIDIILVYIINIYNNIIV